MRRTVLAVAAAAVLATFASGASAAPDRSLTLSRDSRSAAWTGAIGLGTYVGSPLAYDTATRCQAAVHGCDTTLLRITTPGALTVRVDVKPSPTSPYFNWAAVHLYRSDAGGRVGERPRYTARRTSTYSEELRVERVTPGYYLVEMEYVEGPGEYSGKATLRPKR